jgi:glycosyltransferase involved in cell wall biosynthesis
VPDVVFPCLNEAAALPWVLHRLDTGYRAIVVDNGSTDESGEIARRLGATVIEETRHGYGAAAHTGLLAATADIVCFCDIDGSFDPQHLPLVVAPVAAGTTDLVLGRRRPISRRAQPWHARVGNTLLTHRLHRRAGLDIHDIGPMRAARRDALLRLHLADRRFGYPLETVIRAAETGWRVTEVDVPYHPRAAGTRSKVTGSVIGTARAARDMHAVLAR